MSVFYLVVFDYRITRNLLKWAYDLSERLQNANDHIINCQKDNGKQFSGTESPEHLAVHAVIFLIFKVNFWFVIIKNNFNLLLFCISLKDLNYSDSCFKC